LAPFPSPATFAPVSKSERIAHLRVENSEGLDPRYAGWFACFNRGDYYEAHDILEDLWLGERGRPLAKFHQGLIQLAGAFVHLKKNRLRPADALFRLAETSLGPYAPQCERIDLRIVLDLIADWRSALAGSGFTVNPLPFRPAPRLTPEA
jgi:predicted metal-dependent hydrolase